MKTEDCPSYEGCYASLCPLDASFNKAVWYKDEPICGARSYRKAHWRRMQRRIAKVGAKGFFTVAMLEKIKLVRKGISGTDPDSRSYRNAF